MLEEHRETLLRSVRYRLDEARRLLAMADVDAGSSDLINAMIDVTDLAVSDTMAVGASVTSPN